MNWIVENLQNSLNTWNNKINEIWNLITITPDAFKGGQIWKVMLNINGVLQSIGLSLLVLFFVVGVMKTTTDYKELKSLEHAIKLFVRFAIAKGVVTYGLELMLAIFNIVQGMISSIMKTVGFGKASQAILSNEIIEAIEDVNFLDSIPLFAVVLIGGLIVIVLSFIMILSVYGRFFRLYLYTAISPIPLSTFAGEPTQSIGIHFLKSYAGVCLEGVIIVLSCVIFSLFASSNPVINTSESAVSMVWSYLGETIFNMLILVGIIKASDKIIKEMLGL